MDSKDLYYFIQVQQYGSLSKAAEYLFISQQGLGVAMDRLENELGCRLFTRTARGTTLTLEGQALLPRAERILAAVQECRAHFKGTAPARHPLRIVCAFGVYSLLVDELICTHKKAQPQMCFEMTEYPDGHCLETMAKGRADLCFSTAPPQGKAFVSHLLSRHPVCAVVHESHPLASCPWLDVAQLRGEVVIQMNSTFRIHHDFMQRCAAEGFAPHVLFEASEIALVHRMAEKGAGIGITVGTVYQEYKKAHVRLIPFSDAGFTWDIYGAANAKAIAYDAAGGFWRHVLQQAVAVA